MSRHVAAARRGGRPGPVARLAPVVLGAAVTLADLTPPGIRYGYVHPVVARLLRGPLPVLAAAPGVEFRASCAPPGAPATGPALRCGLLADHLDVGGVGRVVELLAEGLGAVGVEPVVVCPSEGARTRRLRALGVEVRVVGDDGAAAAALADVALDVVQLHSAPGYLTAAASGLDVPLVPVLHNTEIHYSPPMWRAAAELFARAASVVAVSEVVRRFHVEHLPVAAGEKIVVVPNGSPPLPATDPGARARARAALEQTLGTSLTGLVVVVCLARYDSQKNVAGLVASFLSDHDDDVRLVVAGEPSDRLEHLRAEAIRRADRRGDHVHLLGGSHAATLLTAADVFVLDSFFEGWPLAATEALAAGLPLVLSDAGGAAELVARAAEGSAVVANPTGPAAEVTDRRARDARRRARRQRNAGELAAALRDASRAARAAGRPSPPADAGYADMVDGHARVLRRAVHARLTPDGPGEKSPVGPG